MSFPSPNLDDGRSLHALSKVRNTFVEVEVLDEHLTASLLGVPVGSR